MKEGKPPKIATMQDEMKQLRIDMDKWRSDICGATEAFNFCSRRVDKILKGFEQDVNKITVSPNVQT